MPPHGVGDRRGTDGIGRRDASDDHERALCGHAPLETSDDAHPVWRSAKRWKGDEGGGSIEGKFAFQHPSIVLNLVKKLLKCTLSAQKGITGKSR